MKYLVFKLVALTMFWSCSGYRWTVANRVDEITLQDYDCYLVDNEEKILLENLIQTDNEYKADVPNPVRSAFIQSTKRPLVFIYSNNYEINRPDIDKYRFYVSHNNIDQIKYTEFDPQLKSERTAFFITGSILAIVGLIAIVANSLDDMFPSGH